MRLKSLVALCAVVCGLVMASGAGAATYTVWAGPGFLAQNPAGVPDYGDANTFFPRVLKIHVGDSVTFKSDDFHTATYLGGQKWSQFPIFTKSSSQTYSGVNDAAGQPFYFNGLPLFQYNPATLAPSGPTAIKRGVMSNSGVLSKAGYTYTFSKPGAYTFICLVHAPMMKMTVIVVPRRAHASTSGQISRQIAHQLKFDFAAIEKIDKIAPKQPNTVYAGVGRMVPGGSVELMTFKPHVLTVKAGTTVTFVNDAAMEPHNMVFGPQDYAKQSLQTLDLQPRGPGSPNQAWPFFFYGSDPLTSPYVYNGQNHGNGFLATPLIGPPHSGLPSSFQITFTTPGDYKYFCAIHGPMMNGEIVVTS